MKTKIFATFAILIIGFITKAQTFEWAIPIQGVVSNDHGRSIDVDDSGNIYTTGRFSGTVDFDPGPDIFNLSSTNGGGDIYVLKLDASGSLIWAKSFGGSESDIGYSTTVDDAGNVYTTGEFGGTADFDPGPSTYNLTSNGLVDVFVQKMDASGNFLWAKSFGGSDYDRGHTIFTDTAGNVYTTGKYGGTVDFDPGTSINNITSNGNDDVFVHKLDASGNFLWVKSFGGTSTDFGFSTIDDSGNVYTTGHFYGTVDFNPGPGIYNLDSDGAQDVFVQKLDASGNFLWAKSFGNYFIPTLGRSITADTAGNVYIIGTMGGGTTVDFDPGPGTYNLTANGMLNDIFVEKLDALGNFLWAKTFGGINEEDGASITTDDSGNVYTTGYFQDTVDFNPNSGTYELVSNGGHDVFLQKMDASGSFLWAKSFGSTSMFNDQGHSISVDYAGNVYTEGFFSETVDFDPGNGSYNLTSTGIDGFLHKMNQCTLTTSTDIITACDTYTWIDNITYTSSNNTATYTLTNVAGCDSVVTLDLTINSASAAVTNNSPTLTASVAGATYQWIDCDNGNAPISGETAQSFTASDNGNYAVIVTENGCTDTSSCVTVANVGILENNLSNNISVYPNPTKSELNIDLKEVYNELTLKLSNVVGQIVYTSSVKGQQHITVPIESGSGIYFLELSNNQGKKSIIKVIKN